MDLLELPPGGQAAQAILAVAGLAGVEHLWFCSGNDVVSFQEAAAVARERGLPAPQIRTMVHEHVALAIAMGETVVRRAPAMVAAHVDVGLLHMGGGLHNAYVGRYPVLIVTGYPPIAPEHRTIPVFWKQQRWDQAELVRQLMKWDYRLAAHDDPALVTARALQLAMSPPEGPAYLTLPKEVATQRSQAPLTVRTPAYLGLARLGAGDDDALQAVAARLLAAERPLLITDRAGRDPAAVAALGALAREFGLAVRATRHRLNLPDGHPSRWAGGSYNSAGIARGDGLIGLADADAVLVVDHLVPWIPVRERPAAEAWIAVAGPDPAGAHVPLYEFPADLRMVVDPARFLEALAEAMRAQRTAADRERGDRRWRAFEEHAGSREAARAATAPGLDELTLAAGLAEVLTPEDALTWEMTDTNAIPRDLPDTLFDSGGSSLGWAVAAGIGIRAAQPERFAACLTGDGAYMFGVPSALLWAQTQYAAPVLTVVANNRGYRTGTVRLREDYPDGAAVQAHDFSGGTFDPPPDFAAEARAAGGFGVRVTEPADLVPALEKARGAVESGAPAVVDVWLPPLVAAR